MKLSKARQAALDVLCTHGRARYSNRTAAAPPDPPAVYWQVADWLIAEGLAEWAPDEWEIVDGIARRLPGDRAVIPTALAYTRRPGP